MANTIYLNNKDSMSMSNGCTDVFLTTIGLSGSRLAVTDGEKRLILWLLERDQWVWGRGIVGFNLEYWKNPAGKRWITSLIKTFWRPRFEAIAA